MSIFLIEFAQLIIRYLSEERISYMVEGIRNYEASEGTDLKAIFDNYVSVGVATNIS